MLPLRDIELGLLDVGEHEQRFDYEGPEMDDLVASIRKDGVLVPLIIRPCGERFVVVEGHRRREAAIRAGLVSVPCQVQEGDLALSRRIAFVCNLFRKDPSPVELGVAIARAAADGSASVEELAKGLNRSVDWVKRQVAMMEWPEDVLQAIHGGRLSVAAAANLAAVTDDSYRDFLLGHAVANGATARTTAAWLQQWEAGQPAPVAVTAPPAEGEAHAAPMMPQAPCLCCGGVRRTDELSYVPLCAPCIQRVRHVGGH
jgi:ParB family chromosome partitioning protein